jgi:hypothetical protein
MCSPDTALSNETEGLITSVRLRRGKVARTVRVAITTPLTEPDRLAPGKVLDTFIAGVKAGLLGPGTLTEHTRSIVLRPEHGVCADVLEARFSAITPQAFAVLPAMVESSVPGARRVEVHELYDDERVLVVRTLEPDPEATLLSVDWEIALPAGQVPCVRVELVDAASPQIVLRVEQLLHDWAELIRLGAFRPTDGTAPAAERMDVLAEQRALTATFGALRCGYGGFEALFEALDRIHTEQPIARLSFADVRE